MKPLPFPAKEVPRIPVRPGDPLPALSTSPVILEGAIDDYPLLRRMAARKTDFIFRTFGHPYPRLPTYDAEASVSGDGQRPA
jgi:hypothetical protein